MEKKEICKNCGHPRAFHYRENDRVGRMSINNLLDYLHQLEEAVRKEKNSHTIIYLIEEALRTEERLRKTLMRRWKK